MWTPKLPAAAGSSFDVDRIVEIARVIRIDRDDEFRRADLPVSRSRLRIDCLRNLPPLREHVRRKFRRKMVLPDDREHVDPGCRPGPSTSMISPSGLTWRDSHGFEPNDYLVAHSAAALSGAVRGWT